ncbi:MAG: response regulator [Nibricoccus sp.]
MSGQPNVLIVDRDAHAAVTVEGLLKAAGYEQVVIAPDAGRAHACARPDLMLFALDAAHMSAQLVQARELQKRWQTPTIFVVDDGVRAEMEKTGLVSPSGYVTKPVAAHALRVATDAAQRLHQVEARLRRIESRLQEVQRLQSVGVVAGGIAHEFNNLLTGIYGAVAVSRKELPGDSPVARRLDTIEAAATRAADLTQRLSVPAGDASASRVLLSLNELVEESLALLRADFKRNVNLQTGLAENLPAIKASDAQLRQVVLNLVTNAAEAIGDKAGCIRVLTYSKTFAVPFAQDEQELKPGDYAVLEVADNGCGMDEITRSRIFDPLFSTKNANRGLGLATVARIVRRHRGLVAVESFRGQGSCFKVFLPIQAGTIPAFDTAPGLPGSVVSSPPVKPAEPSGSVNGTIMVVDDDEGVRVMAKWIIEKAGGSVVLARDGDEALRIYKESPQMYKLLLLDLTMPRMGGLETMQKVRAIRPDQQIVIVTGHNEGVISDEVPEGAVGFMQKPFNPDRLRTVLRKYASTNGA